MTMQRRSGLRLRGAAAATLVCASLAAPGAEPAAPGGGLYELTTETLLPHLEENLRYATTRERLCLRDFEATQLFAVLKHEAFADCTLLPSAADRPPTQYTLVCKNPQAATGSAQLVLADNDLRGVLDVKMGGKNMTLQQRISGTRVGACEAAR